MFGRRPWLAAVLAVAAFLPLAMQASQAHTPNAESTLDRPALMDITTRIRRQVPKRQGIFSLLSQLVRQTKNDTDSAYRQISQLISDSFGSDSSTTPAQGLTTASSTSPDAEGREGNVTTTTAMPYRATAGLVRTILRRNLLGLRNLFVKEWRTAVVDSGKNVAAAGKELRSALRPILATNSSATNSAR